MKQNILIILFLFSYQLLFSQEKLTVEVKGINMETKGYLRVGIFQKEGYLDNTKVVDGKIINIHSSTMQLEFLLPEGKYAVVIVQDEDKNGELNKNFIGYPTEPYAFSNNAKGSLGPASFEDASFYLKESKKITINL